MPTGRLGRFARLAALGARTGAGLVLSRDRNDALAERAADVLGSMRGLAAKVGQMASYVDGFVPEAQQPAFEAALAKLRAAAPKSSSAAIRSRIEEELGAPLDRLFATFDAEPFACASIGQVHRATLDDGRVVAVKVQHPGIERAIAADLDNAGMLEAILRSTVAGKMGTADILRVVRARFAEELDYLHEAENQRWFARTFAGRPDVVIPDVIDDRSSSRVLTTLLISGRTLDEVAADPEPSRAAWTRTLWRTTFEALLVHRRFNADPHPGNFLFQADGRIAFLDFGCVQPIGPAHNAAARAMHRAAITRDEPAFRTAAAHLTGTHGGAYGDAIVSFTRRCFEPLFSSPFRFTRTYVADLVTAIQSMKRNVLFARDGSTVPVPPDLVFMNRLQFGFFSVLARLESEVDFAALERPLLDPAAAGRT